MTTIISEKGQITIPKKLRDNLGLAPGVAIDFEISGGKLIGKKVSEQSSLLRWIGKGKMPGGKKGSVSTENYLEAIRGKLTICEAVIAEISPALSRQKDVEEFLDDSGAEFTAISREASVEAGQMFSRYLESGSKRGRVAADFLIGCHAKLQADRLLTRDDGFYRKHFGRLKVISP